MKTQTALAIGGGTLVVVVVAALGLLAHLVGNGLALSPDVMSSGAPPPTPTKPITASSPPDRFGSGLLQPDDFFQIGLQLSADELRHDGGQSLSVCTGGLTMAGLTAGKVAKQHYVDGSWRDAGTIVSGGGRLGLTESVSRGDTKDAARGFVALLVSEFAWCSYRQDGNDLRLGGPITVRTDTGAAVRFVTYSVDGTAVGGVGVFRNGRTFGVYELIGAGGDDPSSVLDQLARRAVARCG